MGGNNNNSNNLRVDLLQGNGFNKQREVVDFGEEAAVVFKKEAEKPAAVIRAVPISPEPRVEILKPIEPVIPQEKKKIAEAPLVAVKETPPPKKLQVEPPKPATGLIPEEVIIIKKEEKKEAVPIGAKEAVGKPPTEISKAGMGLNLIPEDLLEISGLEREKVMKAVWTVAMAGLFLCLGIYIVIDYFDKKADRGLKTANFLLQEANAKIALAEDIEKQGVRLYSKIHLAKSILNNHIYWSNVLKFLEANTVPTVYYRSISNNVLSGALISAIAIDFESAARQLLAFQKAVGVKEVNMSSISLEQSLNLIYP